MDIKITKLLNLYLAYLRSMALVHQFNHWTVSGKEFYQSHLLLDRVYSSLLDDIDQAAEKIAGVFGSESIDYKLQQEMISNIMIKNAIKEKSMDAKLNQSLTTEMKFLTLSQIVFEKLDSSELLTLGFDDFIMSTASHREEAVYLLKQSME